MSRVTIKDLFWEISNDKYASNVWDGYKDIEVVPREMVEMIIERIKGNKSVCIPDSYAEHTLDNVLQYAESLLEKFENDEEVQLLQG